MELNPQPNFSSGVGLSFAHGAAVTDGRLNLPSGSSAGPPIAYWTSPETLSEGYYRYSVVVDESNGAQDQCGNLVVGGSSALLYGAGIFQGVIYTKATTQTCSVRLNDTEFSAKVASCSISRVA